MKFKATRTHIDLLNLLPDGSLPMLELYKIISSREDGTPFENFLWDSFKIQHVKYDARTQVMSLTVAAESTMMCPGGHCDVSVWEDYTLGDYWGHSASYTRAYEYLESIGFIKIEEDD